MKAYYNEFDPFAAKWLRQLIERGLVASGDVDERDINDVRPSDLRGYTQHHFFAGIGGWSLALRLVGWPDDRPVWTGSCPCQPFSAAGEGAGFADERHLWPAYYHLIQECKPGVIFGEQVDAAIRYGWLDLIQTDLEEINYAFAAACIPAAGFGAPQARHRLYFVSYSNSPLTGGLADGEFEGLEGHAGNGCDGHEPGRIRTDTDRSATTQGAVGLVANADGGITGDGYLQPSREHGLIAPHGSDGDGGRRPCPTNGFWRDADWIKCRDEFWRPVEPGTFPLANGIPNRVGLLRGYGNAIVPQCAAAFVQAYMEARSGTLRGNGSDTPRREDCSLGVAA